MSREDATVRVLHVDDDEDLCELAALHLEQANEHFEVITETNASDGLARVEDGSIDCVVSDHDMPGMDGLEFLRAVRERDGELPFILYTGKGSEEIASEAISAGVTDYLQKGTSSEQYELLANRIDRGVSEVRARSALEESERRLSTLITNLPGMVYRCRNERDWPMEFVSEGARELTGYEASAIECGEIDWAGDVVHPEDRDSLWKQIQLALRADEPFEVTYRIETADGERRWVWERGRTVEPAADGVAVLEGFVTDITVRRTRERELAAEREFTKSVIDSIEDVFYLVDLDGRFVRWNERMSAVTGYSDAEIARMEVFDVVPPEYHDPMREATRETVKTGTSTVEAEIVTKDGDRRRMEFRGTYVEAEREELTGICGIARDVTERAERERRLEQYRTLVENVGDPMYVLDADGAIEMVNERMARSLGTTPEEMAGQSVERYMPSEDVEVAREAIRELLGDDERSWMTVELRLINSEGEVRYHEDKIAILTDDDGEFVGSVGIIRDITERKQRERELLRHETIIQAIGDPVYTLDEHGEITFANEAMESLSGYDLSELVGRDISMLIPDEDVARGQELIAELLRREDVTYDTFEMDVITSDGTHVPCENHIALLPREDGQFRGTAGVVRDISERKQRERRLEEFASVVSHDLRNPLNVIQGRLELAMDTDDLDQLRPAVAAAERMERLIENLLALAREGEVVGEFEEVSLGEIARSAWSQVATESATLLVERDGPIASDPDRLSGLFENLFHNALEHGRQSDDGVTIRVGTTEAGFFVEDDGPGIPVELREDVFERGYTTSEDGTGFGLAIVEEIVAAHGWSIRVTEGRSGGARFEIET